MTFKRSIFGHVALAVAVILASPATAADVVTKAPAAFLPGNPCLVATANTPLSCTGPYVGGGLSGQGSNADIIGNGINGSVFAGGMTPTLDVGYQYAKGNWFFAAEFDIGYAFGSSAIANAAGNNFHGFHMSEVFKVGGNLSAFLGNQAPVTIPPTLAAVVIAPYAHVGPTQWQFANAWAGGTSSGAGLVFDIGPQWFGDLRYTYTNFNNAKAGGVTIQNDQSLLVTLNYKFK